MRDKGAGVSGLGETLDKAAVFAAHLSDAARAVLAQGDSEGLGVEVKPDRSLVTRLDRAIEVRLREMIGAAYPHHGIIGEENGDENTGASHVWILDPIDGTAQFIVGLPVYGTLIALAIDGVPVLGIIDVPAIGARWIGVSGQRTTLNGVEIRTRACAGLSEAMMTNSNQDYMSARELPALDALRKKTATRVYGGACLNYGRLAEGRVDVAIDAGQKIFDFAPFRPIIEGAGGVISDWDGRPLTLESGQGAGAGRILAAGDQRCHEQALAVLAHLRIDEDAP